MTRSRFAPFITAGARSALAVALLATVAAVGSVALPAPAQAATGEVRLPVPTVAAVRTGSPVATSGNLLVMGQSPVANGPGGAHVYRLVGGAYVLEAALRPPAPQDGADFGAAVAIDGDTVVVGAQETDVIQDRNGAAYVYRYNGSSWALQQELVPSTRTAAGLFGSSVDIEGNTALVGEKGTRSARAFTRSGATWTEQQVIVPTSGAALSDFGFSVALSGNTAVVGARNATPPAGASGAGGAWVFTRAGGTWTEQQVLYAPTPATGAEYGSDVGVDGNTLVVGEFLRNDTGTAYVYTRSGATWTLQQQLSAADGAASDFYGVSVAVEGDLVAVGAYGDDEGAIPNRGATYTYQRTASTWTEVAKLHPDIVLGLATSGAHVDLEGGRLATSASSSDLPFTDSGAFETRTWTGAAWSASTLTLPVTDEAAGTSVDVSGSAAAVGVPQGWTPGGLAGYVTVSHLDAGSWVSPVQIQRPNSAPADRFGAAVALDGSRLAVGAPGAVAVDIFERSGATTTWNHVQTVTAPNLFASDEFGAAVALDGNRLVVGAPGDDTDGNNSGSVFVFQRSAGVWGPAVRASVIDPARPGDALGRSVAISGNVIAAGAPGDDTVGSNAGAMARITSDGAGGWHTANAGEFLAPAGSAAGDAVGTSVAASASYLVAGAPGADPQGSSSGEAWVYTKSGNLLGALSHPAGTANDLFGQSVAADGVHVAVGSPGDDDLGSGSGSVLRFSDGGGSFPLLQKHLATDGGEGDGFGRSVALDSTEGWLVAGSPGWDGATPGLGAGYALGYSPVPVTTGELRVTTDPPVASTVVVDGVDRDQWGLTWLDLAEGPRTVCFTDVPGYVTPPCEDVEITPGQTTTVEGTFTQMATLQVATSPAVASTITVQDLTGGGPAIPRNKWGVFTRVPPNRLLRVCFGPVAGWDPPPCQNVPAAQLEPGEFKQVTGTFTANASAPGPTGKGELRVSTNPAVPATITIDGILRDEWGLTWLELDPGTYEVCASDVPGYAPAACADVVVAAGTVTEHVFTHSPLGYLRILTEPAQEATLSVDGIERNDWGAWFPIAHGDHEVCFGPSRSNGGRPSPPCQTVTGPDPGQTLTVTGTYP